ncbi:MAG: hypothetical protein ACR2G4_02350 [Pyrinomonadaceae bacterium]
MSTDKLHQLLYKIYDAAKGKEGYPIAVTPDSRQAVATPDSVYVDAKDIDDLKGKLNSLVIKGWIDPLLETNQNAIGTFLTSAGVQEVSRTRKEN